MPEDPSAPLKDLYESKVALYDQAETPQVVAAVRACLPAGGRMLDIGCGTGNLLRQFRPTASLLAGIELSATAASVAATVADTVSNASVESDDHPFEERSFDVVVCADVLEHLADPAVGLAKAIGWCRPGGAIVVSVPNIAYWQCRMRLLRGRWEYEETGIFDNGHLRFFTLESINRLFRSHELELEQYRAVLQPFWRNVRGFRRLPEAVQAPVEGSWARLGARHPGLFAYQHVGTWRRHGVASRHARQGPA